MKTTIKLLFSVLVISVLALPAFSQGRPGGSSDRDHGSSGAGVSSAPAVSPMPSVGSYGSREVSAPRDTGRMVSYGSGGAGRGTAYLPAPNLKGTSFTTLTTFYDWQNFYYYLQTRYMMNSLYFTRFYRNVEPLVTPQLLRLTMREPLRLSMQMMTAVDELEALLQARQSGKPVDKQEIAAKAEEIRDLAKHIRSNQALSFVDQRKEKDVLKGDNIEKLGLEAVSQLREMATDLNTQLKAMYTQDTTSTVSVSSLSQPSISSLSKGIEKLSRAIESSAKKI